MQIFYRNKSVQCVIAKPYLMGTLGNLMRSYFIKPSSLSYLIRLWIVIIQSSPVQNYSSVIIRLLDRLPHSKSISQIIICIISRISCAICPFHKMTGHIISICTSYLPILVPYLRQSIHAVIGISDTRAVILFPTVILRPDLFYQVSISIIKATFDRTIFIDCPKSMTVCIIFIADFLPVRWFFTKNIPGQISLLFPYVS